MLEEGCTVDLVFASPHASSHRRAANQDGAGGAASLALPLGISVCLSGMKGTKGTLYQAPQL